MDGATINIDSTSSLTITDEFLHRGDGTLNVDVASNAVLSVQKTCQLSGGNLALYSSSPVLTNPSILVCLT